MLKVVVDCVRYRFEERLAAFVRQQPTGDLVWALHIGNDVTASASEFAHRLQSRVDDALVAERIGIYPETGSVGIDLALDLPLRGMRIERHAASKFISLKG